MSERDTPVSGSFSHFDVPNDLARGSEPKSSIIAANARLRTVLDGMSEAFCLLSPEFIVLDVNAEALRLAISKREQVIGQSLWKLYPGTKDSPVGELYRKAMGKRVAVSLEHEYVWPDGRNSWLDTRAFPTDDGCIAVFFRDVTDRHLVEKVARANAERFEAAVTAFTSALWTNDNNGRMTGKQASWEALTGQAFEDYQGYGWAQAIHPDDMQPTLQAWQQAVAERRLFEFEHRLRRRDGEWRFFAIRAVPVLDDDGTIREWVGIHTDITEARENEVRFRQLAENIESVFYIYEIDEGRVSYVSPAYERVWQQQPELLYADASTFLRDVHPDDHEAIATALRRQRNGESTNVRYRLALPGIGIRYIHDRAFVTRQSDRHSRRVVGIADDVTTTTSQRLQLAANAKTFEALVRNAPFGIYVVGSDFRMLQASVGAERVAPDLNPLVGRDFADVMRSVWSEPFASEAIARFRHTLTTGETFASDRTMEQRFNSELREAYDWRIDQIELPDGSTGVVCYFYDLSERIALEGQLKQALDDKDMLLREIDHRVRNSIAMVSSLLRMQSGSSDSKRIKQALAVASARIDAIARIHERLYKGKQLGVVAFGTYLEEICLDLQNSLGNGDVSLDLSLVEVDLPVDQAVPLGLVANELVTNAFKHAGGAMMRINIELSSNANEVELTVADNGPGMPMDFGISKSPGLGMKVIALLVRQLNGTLIVPRAGQTATFTVTAPIKRNGPQP